MQMAGGAKGLGVVVDVGRISAERQSVIVSLVDARS